MRPPTPDSRDLLRRAAAGDDGALTQLYETHVDGLYAFVYPRVGRDPSLAEDVVQETFLRALARTGDYDPARGGLGVWLAWQARNAIRDGLREHRRGFALAQAAAELDATMTQLYRALDRGPIADELLARAETRDLVTMTIAALPPRYRDALESKYVREDSMATIAAALAITEDAAKSLLARARRAFRATFEALARSDAGATAREVAADA
ncbi:MAG: sigma-70 family RNA polymerase sigma factor [Nannocystaceae bacterium]